MLGLLMCAMLTILWAVCEWPRPRNMEHRTESYHKETCLSHSLSELQPKAKTAPDD